LHQSGGCKDDPSGQKEAWGKGRAHIPAKGEGIKCAAVGVRQKRDPEGEKHSRNTDIQRT